jgi:chemotaxis protein CheD
METLMIHLALKEYDNIHYLMPGELIIAKTPSVVWTVLGSCVSVILYHKKTGIGAICHAQLPGTIKEGHCFDNCPEKCLMDTSSRNQSKYVTCAVKYMLGEIKKLNIKLDELDIRVFGGADVIPSNNKMSIGKLNVETAFKILQDEGLSVTQAETGGSSGRNILFISATGEVLTETHAEKKTENLQKKLIFPLFQ